MAFVVRDALRLFTTSTSRRAFPLPHTSPRRLFQRHLTPFPHRAPTATIRAMATQQTGVDKDSDDATLVNDVLTFWFGTAEFQPFDTMKSQFRIWYSGGKEIDKLIRSRFGVQVADALEGRLDHLAHIGDGLTEDNTINEEQQKGLRGALALTILLDQFPRNIFRGTAHAFSGDARALDVAHSVLQPERWSIAKRTLPAVVRMSFLLPLMHQEALSEQQLCVDTVAAMVDELRQQGKPAEECCKQMEVSLKFAMEHRDIIEQFGRFPYRNEALDRESTPEEVAFLESGPRFGQ